MSVMPMPVVTRLRIPKPVLQQLGIDLPVGFSMCVELLVRVPWKRMPWPVPQLEVSWNASMMYLIQKETTPGH